MVQYLPQLIGLIKYWRLPLINGGSGEKSDRPKPLAIIIF